ncbi:hypothetical protein EV182_006863, partial [Spiromyces aspiralis]
MDALREVRFALKIIRRLLVHGILNQSHNADAVEFFKESLECLNRLFLLEESIVNKDNHEAMLLRKVILLFGKLYLDLQEYNTLEFVRMPGSMLVVKWYWERIHSHADRRQSAPGPKSHFDRLLVQGLLLFKRVLKNTIYSAGERGKYQRSSHNEDPEARACIQELNAHLFTPGFVAQLADTLIRGYIMLQPEDIENWEDDPEEWLKSEEADHYEHDSRPCAERLFMVLFAEYKGLLLPSLLAMVDQVK